MAATPSNRPGEARVAFQGLELRPGEGIVDGFRGSRSRNACQGGAAVHVRSVLREDRNVQPPVATIARQPSADQACSRGPAGALRH